MVQFPTTSWTLVIAAGRAGEASSNAALIAMCERYWYPLYAFLRRKGYDAEQAEDLVQGFLLKVIENRYLQAADQDRGRFRSFLIAALQHFVSDQHDRDRAVKRGGRAQLISIDVEKGEQQFRAVSAVPDPHTPESLYEAEWAATLLDRVMDTLRQEWVTAGKARHFERLKPFLSGTANASYREAATQLGMSEANVKVTVHRLRKRFGQLLREEISITVAHPDQVEEELRFLLGAASL